MSFQNVNFVIDDDSLTLMHAMRIKAGKQNLWDIVKEAMRLYQLVQHEFVDNQPQKDKLTIIIPDKYSERHYTLNRKDYARP